MKKYLLFFAYAFILVSSVNILAAPQINIAYPIPGETIKFINSPQSFDIRVSISENSTAFYNLTGQTQGFPWNNETVQKNLSAIGDDGNNTFFFIGNYTPSDGVNMLWTLIINATNVSGTNVATNITFNTRVVVSISSFNSTSLNTPQWGLKTWYRFNENMNNIIYDQTDQNNGFLVNGTYQTDGVIISLISGTDYFLNNILFTLNNTLNSNNTWKQITSKYISFNQNIVKINNDSLGAVQTYSAQSSTQFSTVSIAVTLVILLGIFGIFWKFFNGSSKGGNSGSGGPGRKSKDGSVYHSESEINMGHYQ